MGSARAPEPALGGRVVVSEAEIALVLEGRRRMLRLPFVKTQRCPVEYASVYRLQPRLFAASEVTVTVATVPRKELLEDLTKADAKREGHVSVEGALAAWRRAHGVAPGQHVWAFGIVVGDWSDALRDDDVWLSKSGDYTLRGGRQAVPGDPPLVLPRDGDGELARVMRIATRTQPQIDMVRTLRGQIETCRDVMTSMKARNLVRRLERTADALEREILSELGVPSSPSAAAAGSQGEVDRPSRGLSPAVP